jgi:hypothetical protein
MLSELENVEVKVRGYMMPAVERDCWCSPKPISQTTGGKKKGIKAEPEKPGELPEAAKRQLDRALGEPLHSNYKAEGQTMLFAKEDTNDQQT